MGASIVALGCAASSKMFTDVRPRGAYAAARVPARFSFSSEAKAYDHPSGAHWERATVNKSMPEHADAYVMGGVSLACLTAMASACEADPLCMALPRADTILRGFSVPESRVEAIVEVSGTSKSLSTSVGDAHLPGLGS